VLNTPVRYVGNDQARAVAALQESVQVAIRVGFFKQQVACGNHCFLGMRIPAIVTADSDGSRPLVPIDRDQCDGAVRCIF
jgi:hypothetical protein